MNLLKTMSVNSHLVVTDKGLWSPISFINATDDEIAKKCDGAGVPWFDVPDHFLGLSITDAANIHDWMYIAAKEDNDRLFADFVFFLNMILIILNHDLNMKDVKSERRKLWPRLRLACIYFISVWRYGVCSALGQKPPKWGIAAGKVLSFLRKIGLPW